MAVTSCAILSRFNRSYGCIPNASIPLINSSSVMPRISLICPIICSSAFAISSMVISSTDASSIGSVVCAVSVISSVTVSTGSVDVSTVSEAVSFTDVSCSDVSFTTLVFLDSSKFFLSGCCVWVFSLLVIACAVVCLGASNFCAVFPSTSPKLCTFD